MFLSIQTSVKCCCHAVNLDSLRSFDKLDQSLLRVLSRSSTGSDEGKEQPDIESREKAGSTGGG